MNWFILALSAPLLWSISNYIDKYILSRAKDKALGGSGGFLILTSLSSLIFAGLVSTHVGYSNLFIDNSVITILVLSGIIEGLYLFFYFLALEKESASTVIALFQLVPIFGFIFGYLILGEVPAPVHILGMLVIIFGTFLVLKKKEERFSLQGKALPLMLVSAIFVALYNVMFKFVGENQDFWTSIFWQSIGIGVLGIILFTFSSKYRKQFSDMLIHRGIRFLSLNFISEVMNILAVLATNAAILLAPVAIVLSINSVQPIFVFIEGIIIYALFPKLFGVSEKPKLHLYYVIGIILVCVGGFLAYI